MCSIQKICLALSLLSPRNLAVTPGEGVEKYIKIKKIKKGKGKAYFVSEREKCLYFLTTITSSSHKVIHFKRNKLYRIQLCIFSPMLVENIEFKVTKITYI